MLDVREVLALMVEETRRRGLPLPVPERVIYEWAEGLDLPREGKIILFTGGLYQLVPYINSMVRYLEALEGRRGGRLAMKLARRLKLVDLAASIAKPDKGEVEYSRRILRSIVSHLRRAGVEVAYPPGVDWYSGVLLYDMGLESEFAAHARRVAREIMRVDPDLIITVDPHTTMVLKEAYPWYVDGFNYEVKPYLQVLAERGYKPPGGVGGRWAVHDPCLYARGLGMVEEPRRLLAMAGVEAVDPKRSRRMTYCCGGPLESISPKLSRKIAQARIRELASVSKRVVVMCPICLANLRRAAEDLDGVEVEDISLVMGAGE